MSSNKSTCPACGKAATGNFCQHCGASLGGRFCDQCGTKADQGSRFCNQCGASIGAGGAARAPAPSGAPAKAAGPRTPAASRGGTPARRGAGASAQAEGAPGGTGNLAWWIAGGSMFVLILVVGISMVRPAGPSAPAAGGPMTGGNPAAGQSSVDLSSMSPREAADRLFNRVMQTMSQGDTAGALAFQPMAVQSYGLVADLDLDGLVHVALLEMLVAPEEALATAERILAVEPEHVIGLGLAADASVRLGNEDGAEELYRRLLSVYDAQAGRSLVEYETHQGIMTGVRSAAEAFLAGR